MPSKNIQIEPPNLLANARVLCWAWSGHEPFGLLGSADGLPVEIYGLAICQYENSSEIYRFSCDKNWQVQQDSLHDSVDEAKELIPEQYKQVLVQWIDK